MPKTPPSPRAFADCPDWGRGGSYLADPVTGIRTLIERGAAPPDDVVASAAAPAPAADSSLTEEH